jgi:hypothetical protein
MVIMTTTSKYYNDDALRLRRGWVAIAIMMGDNCNNDGRRLRRRHVTTGTMTCDDCDNDG